MYILLIVLTLIAAVLMICVVLIQKSKGGGLSSTFAGSNQIMGVRRTNSFIEKVTWILAGAICLFAILSTFCMPNTVATAGPRVKAPAVMEQQNAAGYDSQLPVVSETPAAEVPAGEGEAETVVVEVPAETPAE